MNKKGFTLVEVLLSVTLLSIVLVSMLNTLIKLREVYSLIADTSDIEISTTAITRVITSDIMDNNGIVNLINPSTGATISYSNNKSEYSSNDSEGNEASNKPASVAFLLASGKKRKLEVHTVYTLNSGTQRTNKSTLKYYDITDSSNPKIIYIKTLESTIYAKQSGSYVESTLDGYKFKSLYILNNKVTPKDTTKYNSEYVGRIQVKLSNSDYNIEIVSSAKIEN